MDAWLHILCTFTAVFSRRRAPRNTISRYHFWYVTSYRLRTQTLRALSSKFWLCTSFSWTIDNVFTVRSVPKRILRCLCMCFCLCAVYLSINTPFDEHLSMFLVSYCCGTSHASVSSSTNMPLQWWKAASPDLCMQTSISCIAVFTRWPVAVESANVSYFTISSLLDTVDSEQPLLPKGYQSFSKMKYKWNINEIYYFCSWSYSAF